jgi:oligoribonuclease NrnB/cAMP/cGMP phosphodiesterase (DHH superfamily)
MSVTTSRNAMTTVLFHASCSDGFCAAWLMWKYYPGLCEFIPVQYNEPMPAMDLSQNVVVADFSYPRNEMLAANLKFKSFLVFDHHKTSREDCASLPFCTFDDSVCGAMLIWRWLLSINADLRDCDIPWIVKYIQDRDLWRWKLPNSKEINAVIRSYPFDFQVWDDIEASGFGELIVAGEAILRYRQILIDQHTKYARPIRLCGFNGLAAACTAGEIISEVAEKLAELCDFGACYFDKGDGYRVYSLRSRNGTDVSAIAKSFGGGGHRAAAGFTIPI